LWQLFKVSTQKAFERDEKKNLARINVSEGGVIRTSEIFGLFPLPMKPWDETSNLEGPSDKTLSYTKKIIPNSRSKY
jgi:hypothetical protein